MTNARFWAYINGSQVKITLKPGQSLQWGKAYQTDEGWSSEDETWTYHEDGEIQRSYGTDGYDCDGRLSRWFDGWTTLDELAAGFEFEPGRHYPEWHGNCASQRDYQAEAAGY
jgi:hypothetical protein